MAVQKVRSLVPLAVCAVRMTHYLRLRFLSMLRQVKHIVVTMLVQMAITKAARLSCAISWKKTKTKSKTN